MMRRLATRLRAVLTLLTLLLLWSTLLPGVARAAGAVGAESQLTFSPAAAAPAVGEEVALAVSAADWPDLYGYTLVLTWDPALVEVTDYHPGNALGADPLVVQQAAAAGRLELSLVRRGDPTGAPVSGTLVGIQVRGLVPGDAAIRLSAKLVDSNGQTLAAGAFAQATLTVAAAPAGNEPEPPAEAETKEPEPPAEAETKEPEPPAEAETDEPADSGESGSGSGRGEPDAEAGAGDPSAEPGPGTAGAVTAAPGPDAADAGQSGAGSPVAAGEQGPAGPTDSDQGGSESGAKPTPPPAAPVTPTQPLERPAFAAQAAARGARVLLGPVWTVGSPGTGPVILPLPQGVREGVAVRLGPDGSFSPLPTRIIPREGGWVAEVWGGAGELALVTREKYFGDLAGHPAAAKVEALANRMIIEGLTATEFGPGEPLTRAQFSALLVRALGLAPDPAGAAGFTDVASDSWYAGAVGAAVRAGLIRGYEDRTFRADQPLSRTEMVVLLERALDRLPGPAVAQVASPHAGQAGPSAPVAAYSDHAAIPEWARVAVDRATAAGLLGELAPAQFRPDDVATRMEAAMGIYRLLATRGFVPDGLPAAAR